MDEKEKTLLADEETGSTIFTASTQTIPQKSNTKKKKTTQLVALLLALVVLGGGLTILLKGRPQEEVSSEATSDETVTLCAMTQDDIKTILVTPKEGESYTIYQKPAGGFIIEELRPFKSQTTKYNAITKAIATLSAQKLVTEEPEDLAEYGLDQPLVQYEVTFTNGKSFTLLVGDPASTIENGRYMKFANDNTVYISSSAINTNATNKITDYISTEIVPSLETDDNGNTITVPFINITLGGSIRKEELVILPTDDEVVEANLLATEYHLSTPVEAFLNADKFSSLSDSLFGIFATGITVINPTDEDLKTYGLDNPRSTLSVVYRGGSYKLMVGKSKEEICYVMREGVDLIYEVSATSLAPWLEVQLEQLYTPFLYAMYVVDLGRLEITAGDESWDFRLTHKENENGSNELTVTDAGSPVNADLFKKFYQVLITQRVSGLADPVTNNTPLMTLKMTPVDEKADPITVRFFATGPRSVGIEVNGNMSFQTTRSYVDNLLENLEKLMNGQSITVDS